MLDQQSDSIAEQIVDLLTERGDFLFELGDGGFQLGDAVFVGRVVAGDSGC